MKRLLGYLRIAFSAICLVAVVLLIVLWVRSYSWLNLIKGPLTPSKTLVLTSSNGFFAIRTLSQTAYIWKVDRWSQENLLLQMKAAGMPANTKSWLWQLTYFGFANGGLESSYLYPTSLMGIAAGALGWPFAWRFSLRTLLIAITGVAVVLGLAAWLAR
jgi:hypothetical protein